MVNEYVKATRGYITASKLKVFLLCEEAFKVQYIDEVTIEKKEKSRSFVQGTAFHDLMEYGKEFFLEKYSIADSYLKADFIEMIAKRDGVEEKSLKKILLPQLREMYYGSNERAEIQAKVKLTPAEGRDLLGMYETVLKPENSIWDIGGKTDKEQTLEAKYKSLKLSSKPDRLLFYRGHTDDVREISDDMRIPLEEIYEMLHGKNKEVQKDIIKKENIKCIIRDFKTTSDLRRMKKDLTYDRGDKFGYVISMSFYYTIVYALFGIEASVRLDVIEKSAPYATDVIALPQRLLQEKLKTVIIPGLNKMEVAINTGVYEPADRDAVLSNPTLKPYYQYLSLEQLEPSYIEFDL